MQVDEKSRKKKQGMFLFFYELQLYPDFPLLFIIHRILHNIARLSTR